MKHYAALKKNGQNLEVYPDRKKFKWKKHKQVVE